MSGQHAFPSGNHGDGMSLRDYFAGQALVSVIIKCGAHECNFHPDGMAREAMEDMLARKAYLVADAMLEARKTASLPLQESSDDR